MTRLREGRKIEVCAMAKGLRKTGIGVVGDVPWGTHFCHFYETKEGLLDALVPFFKAGLEDREFCVWVISEPLSEAEALDALRQVVPELDRYESERSIEIFFSRDWYLKEGTFDLDRAMNACNEKLKQALARGYAGMRFSGDAFWLQEKDWKDFCEYEKTLDEAVNDQLMTVLCTYPLALSSAAEILDVARTHQFALARRGGDWEAIETTESKQAREEIKRLNEELEGRVVERTEQLTAVNEELKVEIKERERAEESLRVSEEGFRSYFELGLIGMAITSPTKDIVEVNERICEILGYERNELLQLTWPELTHPDDLAADVANFNRVLAGEGDGYSMEKRFICKDGQVIHTTISVKCLRRADGSVDCFLALLQDSTARKQAEERLAYHSLVLENVHDAIVATDEKLVVTAWNRAAQEIYGLTADEALGRDVREVVHSELDAARRDEVLRMVSETGSYNVETIHHRKDGTPIHIAGSIMALRDREGRVIGYVTAHRDITERKRAEEALRQAHDELEIRVAERTAELSAAYARITEILESITDGFTAFDQNWRYIYVNERSVQLLGKPRDQLIGQSVWELFPEVVGTEAYRKCQQAMTEFVPLYFQAFFPALNKWYENFLYPTKEGLSVYWRDISERKRDEAALHEAQAELAHVTRVTTMGELAASIAHEVNQPLGAIVTNGHACLRLLSRDAPDLEGAREAAEAMIGDAMRASEVIKQIRALLKKTAPGKSPLDINEAIREVLALAAGELSKNHVALRTELEAELPSVLGDRVQLQQVMLNLILNGKEAMSGEGWQPRELLVSSQSSKPRGITVSVSDSGVGFDPQDSERIFDAFYTTKTNDGGLGLGLSISRTIIEAHGGRLWATRNEGEGATFRFTLPTGGESQT
jgi:PAS domain S-box-containing protein